MPNETLTPQEVADLLKISKCTVYELIKRKELNGYKVGNKLRIDIGDVEEYKLKNRKLREEKVNKKNKNDTVSESNSQQYNAYNEIENNNSNLNNFIICGQDNILDILSRYLRYHSKGNNVLRAYEGSYNGLCALYRNQVQAVAAHIWDRETGEYNTPFVKGMLPGIATVIINLCYRVQGFYVAKNNPKKIKGWEDLKREDITVINREPGSGSRVLLDQYLRLNGINTSDVKGYEKETFSPMAIVSAVARGSADLGVGTERTFLHSKEIDFIPMQKERYDLIIRKDTVSKYQIEAIMEILSSESFKDELTELRGYDFSDSGKIVGET
ncbi:helix-turn-helix domain-containing protein [Clostridium chromiireducens]|uniref:Helix-turn-helix domain-containing protein n=1 Tax=Clostridium chromiireducens TaxID=225345 RepID=A0A399IS84_9CLOT|nr:helix-turn-helix transcriptional regulator [Clostridium chromiireducens]RII34392.1 helix-turn-helix domain-containing protein [Clostridium chromiireducens]